MKDGNNIFKNTLAKLPNPESFTFRMALDLPFSKYLEIMPNRLTLYPNDVLGSGAFGIVFKGRLDKSKVVAIKTVPKDADQSKLTALLSEAKIMSYVGNHPNIVALLGVELQSLKKGVASVILEFCEKGSLESVLHNKRRTIEMSSKCAEFIQRNPEYIAVNRSDLHFSTNQLLSFCQQVCNAMEFISRRKVAEPEYNFFRRCSNLILIV